MEKKQYEKIANACEKCVGKGCEIHRDMRLDKMHHCYTQAKKQAIKDIKTNAMKH